VRNIYKRLCAVYGSGAVDRSTVGRWIQRVKASGSGETELHDRPWSGRPATATTCCSVPITCRSAHHKSAIEVQWQLLMFWDIRRYAQDRFLEVSQPSTRQRKAICFELLERFDAEREAFLSRIVTGDKTWADHYEPETKRQSME
jgi:hypothetical protein